MQNQVTELSRQVVEKVDDIDVHELLATVVESRWLIAITTALFVAAGMAYNILATPIYEVNGLVQVEDSNGGGMASIKGLSDMFEVEGRASTEMEILRSRMVLGKTVDDLNLIIRIEPEYFPVIGEVIARRATPGVPSKPVWGLRGFAWGGEILKISTFSLPERLTGASFTLTFDSESTYVVENQRGDVIGKGRVGEMFVPRAFQGEFKLFVREFVGHVGVRFNIRKSNRLSTIGWLQGALLLSEKSKGSGILAVTLQGGDPYDAVTIVNQVINNYVRQNVERRSAEAKLTLEFLNGQLPDVKRQLESAEIRFNDFRSRNGTIDIGREGDLLLQQTVRADTELLELEQKRKALLFKFTPQHPSILALDKQISGMKGEQGQFAGRIDGLPKTQQDLLRLTRDLQVSQDLYTQMLNSTQQLKVAQAGTVGNVRVVDYAEVPPFPVLPQKPLILVLSLVLGAFFGLAVAFVRQALRSGVKDAAQIESRLGLSVLATIPESDAQEAIARQLRKSGGKELVLAATSPDDLSIESIRSLRTSLHFALLDAANNILMITGPSPGVGKSFVSVNLAAILASTGARVLLIDADLRRGFINEYFGAQRENGFSELISGQIDTAQAVRRTSIAGLDYIATGALPPNPAELLLHPKCEHLLKALSAEYDHVLIDSPPVMAVTDAAIIGRLVGATLMIARFSVTPIKELELSLRRFQQAGVPINGVLLNRVQRATGYGYGYKYAYAYSYKKRED